MIYCSYNLLDVFRAFICPSTGARDFSCVITAYGVQYLGWWRSAVMCRQVGYGSGMREKHGITSCCPEPDRRLPATLHTICGNNASIVSDCCWWVYKNPKHVEQISAINPSVASSWFPSLRIYNDARSNTHQIL